MFFSQLSTLSKCFSKEEIELADNYFRNLSPSAAQNITVSKVALALDWNYKKSAEFLHECLEIKFLKKSFGVKCPRCGMLLSDVTSLPELKNDPPFCPICGKVIDIESLDYSNDIILLFSIDQKQYSFSQGQQSNNHLELLKGGSAAPINSDSLSQGIQYKLVTNSDLYCPTVSQYEKLKEMLKNVEEVSVEKNGTTGTGKPLEKFFCYLMECCSVFNSTTRQRTETNQIDTMVRINCIISNGIFDEIGTVFYVECKNESSIPSGGYISKMHSILVDSNLKFGIIVSKNEAPNTYSKNAYHYFLHENKIIITYCLNELKDIVNNRINLLESIERKIIEIKTNTNQSLKELGLYTG